MSVSVGVCSASSATVGGASMKRSAPFKFNSITFTLLLLLVCAFSIGGGDAWPNDDLRVINRDVMQTLTLKEQELVMVILPGGEDIEVGSVGLAKVNVGGCKMEISVAKKKREADGLMITAIEKIKVGDRDIDNLANSNLIYVTVDAHEVVVSRYIQEKGGARRAYETTVKGCDAIISAAYIDDESKYAVDVMWTEAQKLPKCFEISAANQNELNTCQTTAPWFKLFDQTFTDDRTVNFVSESGTIRTSSFHGRLGTGPQFYWHMNGTTRLNSTVDYHIGEVLLNRAWAKRVELDINDPQAKPTIASVANVGSVQGSVGDHQMTLQRIVLCGSYRVMLTTVKGVDATKDLPPIYEYPGAEVNWNECRRPNVNRTLYTIVESANSTHRNESGKANGMLVGNSIVWFVGVLSVIHLILDILAI